ncbi:hypothetical protein [Thalassomonas sp. M1454]|uniref:hypothetical protein n=1 Tax=Thalassomonas sp. M1454 TaxID=2594477 RepID=UPI00117F3921|nr:hypothetical protein [Thalassomonas sp. M1454]TRX57817.1 hypothetical protein FNN08_00055 [Thalassomonas sp. M1454]
MRYTLSFGYLNLATPNIVELIIDNNTVVNADMYHEYREFISDNLQKPYAVLVNNINNYCFTPEAIALSGSTEDLSAIAVVSYSKENIAIIDEFFKYKDVSAINLNSFSGLEMGRGKAIRWLESELTKSSTSV